MQVRFHGETADYASVALPLLQRDPVLHTIELTLLRGNSLPADATMLTVWDGVTPIGAALQTPPQPLLCTGLPMRSIPVVVDAIAGPHPELPGVRGTRYTAAEFAKYWHRRTGAVAADGDEDLLYRLGTADWPTVAGEHRIATAADHDLLVAWMCDFAAEAFGHEPDPTRAEAAIAAAAHAGDVYVLWTADGAVVSMAGVRAPAWGAARIGPVFTPTALRGNGYGSAATAVAAQWAIAAGAADVVLFADVANPTSNAIYLRMGFEPVADLLRVGFTY